MIELTDKQRKLLNKHPNLVWAVFFEGTTICNTSVDKPVMEQYLESIRDSMPEATVRKYSLRLISWRFASAQVIAAEEADSRRFNEWLDSRMKERRDG